MFINGNIYGTLKSKMFTWWPLDLIELKIPWRNWRLIQVFLFAIESSWRPKCSASQARVVVAKQCSEQWCKCSYFSPPSIFFPYKRRVFHFLNVCLHTVSILVWAETSFSAHSSVALFAQTWKKTLKRTERTAQMADKSVKISAFLIFIFSFKHVCIVFCVNS